MAARASSTESWEPVWIWRFRNFSVSRFRDDLYGGPCRTRIRSRTCHGDTQSILRHCMLFAHSWPPNTAAGDPATPETYVSVPES